VEHKRALSGQINRRAIFTFLTFVLRGERKFLSARRTSTATLISAAERASAYEEARETAHIDSGSNVSTCSNFGNRVKLFRARN
jgi:hypothetical protein